MSEVSFDKKICKVGHVFCRKKIKKVKKLSNYIFGLLAVFLFLYGKGDKNNQKNFPFDFFSFI
jgi:hypothetical protein